MADQALDQQNTVDLRRFNIRPLKREDLPALEWEGEFAHFRLVYQSVYERIQNGSAFAWIAETEINGLVGQVFLQLKSDQPEWANGWSRAYLYSFRIKPAYRNLGIGTKMIETIQQYLLKKHFSRLTLNVARDNSSGIRFYKRLGFQIVAEEPGIWSYIDHLGKWHTMEEPSWRMEKILT